MFERAVLVHYHEIGLKGRNRAAFENRLRLNLAAALEGLASSEVRRISSRLLVPVLDPAERETILGIVARSPGVVYAGDAYVASREADDLKRAALVAVADAGEFASFRVDARRSSTDHPVPSMEMNAAIGQAIVDATGKKVDLRHAELTVSVEVVQGAAYVYARRVEGPGGLPVGTSGKVVALLSAGIDSPVAAWRMMKRGAVVVGVHFSGVPQTSDASERLAIELGHALERYGGIGRLYTVPFGDSQRRISLAVPPDLRVLIYRRFMIRIAEALARRERAKALVTGESLGQVASQTLENIAAVDEAATLPVFRPLIGMDKLEIIGQARSLGTYAISTQAHEDCCTLFMPRTPATHATIAEVDEGEAGLDAGALVAEALAGATHAEFRCPAYRPPKERAAEAGEAGAGT